MRRPVATFVAIAIALTAAPAARGAAPQPAAKTCVTQAKSVANAKKKLRKAKSAKARKAAQRKLRTTKSSLARCRANAKKPATPTPAPAPAPAPDPAPAPVPVAVPPNAVAIEIPAATTTSITVTTAARPAAPAGFSYRLAIDARDATPGCAEGANRNLGPTGEASSTTFLPQAATRPAAGASAWCTGSWLAAVALVPDAGTTGAKLVAAKPFTLAP